MNKKVLIAEDDLEQLHRLEKLVKSIDENILVYAVTNAADASEILLCHAIDVFLFDISLDSKKAGDTSGIQLVNEIRKMDRYLFTPVIFVTRVQDLQEIAYKDLHCYSYIEKPFNRDVVLKTIKNALKYTTQRDVNDYVYFRKEGILFPIKCKDIVCAESINHIFHIHLQDGTELEIPNKTCKQLIDVANTSYFFQCNRNTVINKHYVMNVDLINRIILLNNGYRVDIGISFRKKVIREFNIIG